ncbi:MAG: hypothetical protein HY247_05910 [archaeon]|nr:MAG: hypothetical protein HY247_05910 [archaeon]
MPEVEVDIRPLKEFVATKCRPDSVLRRVILSEPDLVSITDLAAKLGTWLSILREEVDG